MVNGTDDDTEIDDHARPRSLEPAATERSVRAMSFPRPAPDVARPPRFIEGGFRQVGEDLERRSREWASMVRLLEQHRLALETAEGERDRLAAALDRIVPEVEESGRTLKAMMETSRSGDISGDLAAEFDRSMRALDELERVSAGLSANFLWCRSAWEQYARSVIRAQQMREDRK